MAPTVAGGVAAAGARGGGAAAAAGAGAGPGLLVSVAGRSGAQMSAQRHSLEALTTAMHTHELEAATEAEVGCCKFIQVETRVESARFQRLKPAVQPQPLQLQPPPPPPLRAIHILLVVQNQHPPETNLRQTALKCCSQFQLAPLRRGGRHPCARGQPPHGRGGQGLPLLHCSPQPGQVFHL